MNVRGQTTSSWIWIVERGPWLWFDLCKKGWEIFCSLYQFFLECKPVAFIKIHRNIQSTIIFDRCFISSSLGTLVACVNGIIFLFKIIRGFFWKERNCMSQVIFELHSFSWHFFSWNGRGIWMQMKQAVDWKSILCSQLTSVIEKKTIIKWITRKKILSSK